jgi:hypothetical protein
MIPVSVEAYYLLLYMTDITNMLDRHGAKCKFACLKHHHNQSIKPNCKC